MNRIYDDRGNAVVPLYLEDHPVTVASAAVRRAMLDLFQQGYTITDIERLVVRTGVDTARELAQHGETIKRFLSET